MKITHIYTLLFFTLVACNSLDNSTKNLEENSSNNAILTKDLKSYFLRSNKVELALENCFKNNSSKADISKCIFEANKILDKGLNKRYQEILGGSADEEFSSPKIVEEVRNSLDTWFEFRKNELHFIVNYIFITKERAQHKLLAKRVAEITDFKNPQGNLNPKYKDIEVFDWCKDQSNYGMRKCAQETSKHYDKILNDRYQRIRAQLNGNGKTAFKKTQLAWIKYQKAESQIYSKMVELFEGSMYPTMALQNESRIIQQRAKELDYYYSYFVSD